MASAGRLSGRASPFLRNLRAPATSARTFTSRSSARCLYAKTQAPTSKYAGFARFLSSSAICRAEVQSAPSAKAYIESGVIKGAANPVNVKKVLVIGSGGLSIGQAGEFDYSGW